MREFQCDDFIELTDADGKRIRLCPGNWHINQNEIIYTDGRERHTLNSNATEELTKKFNIRESGNGRFMLETTIDNGIVVSQGTRVRIDTSLYCPSLTFLREDGTKGVVMTGVDFDKFRNNILLDDDI